MLRPFFLKIAESGRRNQAEIFHGSLRCQTRQDPCDGAAAMTLAAARCIVKVCAIRPNRGGPHVQEMATEDVNLQLEAERGP